LRLSKQSEYGLRAIVHLARLQPRQVIQARDLAKREELPAKFLEAILLSLRRGGFLESKVGRDGGYRLARLPRDIRVGEILRLLEGRLTVSITGPSEQVSTGALAVLLINSQLTAATDQVLDQMSLEQLVEQIIRTAGQQPQMYHI
jgi:Rrf2 family protein